MEFNKINRGPKRAANTEQDVYEILDAGFLCHVAFQHQGQACMIPTCYGRKGDEIYLHGSAKNFMLNEIANGQTVCISVTHLDGLVLARSLFDTSVNYRSVVLFGKASIVKTQEEHLEGLRLITENIIKGRSAEVPMGTENELKATLVVKFTIERASAKIRTGGPNGDEDKEVQVWSGVIPLAMTAGKPRQDQKFGVILDASPSVKHFMEQYSFEKSSS